MFKIEDGRLSFWQWDKDQRLIVEDASINEVHFCNRTDDCSLVCEVFEENGKRLVNVPNVLLQDNWAIRVYAYCVNHTKIEEKFIVYSRSKPADYVYTETELKNYDDLVARIDEIEKNGISEEVINNAVNAYLEENPIEAGATESQAAQIEQNRLDIIELQNKEVDLTGYATEEYVEERIDYYCHDFVTRDYVDDAIDNIPTPDLSNYAKKTDIPDVSKFITTIPSEYVTDSELTAKGYQTAAQVQTIVNNAIAAIPVYNGEVESV